MICEVSEMRFTMSSAANTTPTSTASVRLVNTVRAKVARNTEESLSGQFLSRRNCFHETMR
ncbi:MAG: hypothetical protein BWX86_02685 [Verrucomicrobia bacterium ADurb.Bin122]|nr:MAG: hypothetical protein BWX86_02685 [Verrucomicrobia bacterium ADurb.Bin122]